MTDRMAELDALLGHRARPGATSRPCARCGRHRGPDAEVSVKYFTSLDLPNKSKIGDRQKPIWWRALEINRCHIIQGEFRPTDEEVEEQNLAISKKWREKRTDACLSPAGRRQQDH